jgi:hypothetical protein
LNSYGLTAYDNCRRAAFQPMFYYVNYTSIPNWREYGGCKMSSVYGGAAVPDTIAGKLTVYTNSLDK